MAVARVPAIMPHVSSSGDGGDELATEDEIKLYKHEGEEDKTSSENLTEDKSDLIDLTESEVRRRISRSFRRALISSSSLSSTSFFQLRTTQTIFLPRTSSIKCVHIVCCRKKSRSPVEATRRREKHRRDRTSAPFSVSPLEISHSQVSRKLAFLFFSLSYPRYSIFSGYNCLRLVKKINTQDDSLLSRRVGSSITRERRGKSYRREISSREFNYSLTCLVIHPSKRDRYAIRRGKQLAEGSFKRK